MDGNVIHYGGIRIRVVSGSGNVFASLIDINSGVTFTPNAFNLSASSSEPFRPTNLVAQRAIVRLEVNDGISSFFISKIVVYFKPLWTSLPG